MRLKNINIKIYILKLSFLIKKIIVLKYLLKKENGFIKMYIKPRMNSDGSCKDYKIYSGESCSSISAK